MKVIEITEIEVKAALDVSMTDPPALAFANNLHATSGAAALSYATVYPLVMFLRIITPQLLAVIFWGLS